MHNERRSDGHLHSEKVSDAAVDSDRPAPETKDDRNDSKTDANEEEVCNLRYGLRIRKIQISGPLSQGCRTCSSTASVFLGLQGNFFVFSGESPLAG